MMLVAARSYPVTVSALPRMPATSPTAVVIGLALALAHPRWQHAVIVDGETVRHCVAGVDARLVEVRLRGDSADRIGQRLTNDSLGTGRRWIPSAV